MASSARLSSAESLLNVLKARVRGAFVLKMNAMEAALQVLQTRVKAADPRRVMERGYILAVDSRGVVLKSSAGVSKGDAVSMMFADGRLDCTVDAVSPASGDKDKE